MGWFKTLFKGRLDVNKTFDSIATGIDKLSFTAQEKAEFSVKMADAIAEFAKSTLSENTVRSKTRRFIAIFMIINIMLMIWLCIILSLLSVDITTVLEIIALFNLGVVLLTIIGFFFSSYMMTRYQENKKK